MERQVARVEYVNGYADAYDARGVMLSHQRCDKLVGYEPEGFVVMRGHCLGEVGAGLIGANCSL